MNMRIQPEISFLVVLGFTLGSQLSAQTFTTIHDFTATSIPGYLNIDGAIPAGSMILTNHTLFGTAAVGWLRTEVFVDVECHSGSSKFGLSAPCY